MRHAPAARTSTSTSTRTSTRMHHQACTYMLARTRGHRFRAQVSRQQAAHPALHAPAVCVARRVLPDGTAPRQDPPAFFPHALAPARQMHVHAGQERAHARVVHLDSAQSLAGILVGVGGRGSARTRAARGEGCAGRVLTHNGPWHRRAVVCCVCAASSGRDHSSTALRAAPQRRPAANAARTPQTFPQPRPQYRNAAPRVHEAAKRAWSHPRPSSLCPRRHRLLSQSPATRAFSSCDVTDLFVAKKMKKGRGYSENVTKGQSLIMLKGEEVERTLEMSDVMPWFQIFF